MPPAPAPVPARTVGADGLYVWDPERDESVYWSLPWPWTKQQAETNRQALAAPVRKEDGIK